jgi:hypothetical protein
LESRNDFNSARISVPAITNKARLNLGFLELRKIQEEKAD